MKHHSVILFCLFIVSSMHAQFYTNLHIGLKLPASQQTVITEQTATEEKNVNWSFGGGVVPQFGFGYRINTWLGVDMDIAYLFSNTLRWSNNQSGTKQQFNEHARGFYLAPSIVFHTRAGTSFIQPYSSLGIALCPGFALRQQEDTGGPNLVKLVINEFKTRIAIGYHGALGCVVRLGKKVDLDAALQGMILAPALKSGHLIT